VAKFAIVVPVLPGKDAKSVPAALRGRMEEYEESRARAGITMERAYEQPTPMGTFVIGYLESERDFGETMAAIGASDLQVDRDFRAALKDVHGFDSSQPPPGPPPAQRKRGLAFCAPIAPGRSDVGRAFMKEAFVARRDELTESRRAFGQNREVVIINSTPQGDVVAVYLEGDDPVEANRRFAASSGPYDIWFKEQLATLFPPAVDFSQPVPPVDQIWDWHRPAG
jgi:hypothetical protein